MQTETPDNIVPETELARRRRVLQLSEEIAVSLAAATARAREYRELGVPCSEWLPLVLDHAPASLRDPLSEGTIWPAVIDAIFRVADGTPLAEVVPQVLGGIADPGHEDDEDDEDGDPPRPGILPLLASIGMPAILNMFSKPAPAVPPVTYTTRDQAVMLTAVIQQKLEEAPRVSDTDTPAIEAMVILRTLPASIRGSLSMVRTTKDAEFCPGVFRMMSPGKDERGRDVLVEQFFTAEDIVSFALVREVTPTPGSRIFTT